MNRANFAEQALELCLGTAPLFVVTIRSWSSAILILGALASLLFLVRTQNESIKSAVDAHSLKWLIIFILLAPVLAIVFSSAIRGSNVWANYDSPSRFLVAIAVFLFALRRHLNIANYLQYTAPISLVITMLHQALFTSPELWGAGRMSTYFADPLVFGYTSLTLGLISLASIHLLGKDDRKLVALKLLGAGLGVYLSIMSGSRTGWLAVPLVIGILVNRRKLLGKKAPPFATLGVAALLAFGVYSVSLTVQHRMLLGIHEVLDYSWNGMASETSVGFRITFLRIASDMFAVSPWAGFGDNGYDLTILPSQIFTYATPESIRLAFNAGFHNEMVSNAVRYGICGLLSAALLLLGPMAIFAWRSKSDDVVQRANALLGLIFTICFFVSSFSTEVFDLKYVASFYALLIAMLCASAISKPIEYKR